MDETTPNPGEGGQTPRAPGVQTKVESPHENKTGKGRWYVFYLTIVLAMLSTIALTCAIWLTGGPDRIYAALLAVSGFLIVGGLLFLVVLIPEAGAGGDLKTEFYSARAAYLCVIAGLCVSVIVAIAAGVGRVVLTIRGVR